MTRSVTIDQTGLPIPSTQQSLTVRSERETALSRSRSSLSVRPSASLADVNGCVKRHSGVQVFDVPDVHADAAVRGGVADRPVLDGSMDPCTVVEAHPARLDRVV